MDSLDFNSSTSDHFEHNASDRKGNNPKASIYSMSDSEEHEGSYGYDDSDEASSLEFSDVDYGDDNSLNELDHEDTHAKVMFSFPTSTTSSGIPTHRMKYQALCIDEIQKYIEQKVKELSDLLQLDNGKCLVLLLTYGWNEHKLLDDYVSCDEQRKLLLQHGVYDKAYPKDLSCLLTKETGEEVICSICCCSPEPSEPMTFFSLFGCKHKFCTECYSHYIQTKNEGSQVVIDCPFSDPKCTLKITTLELGILSDFMEKSIKQPKEKLHQAKLISEDEIKQLYNLSSDDEQLDSDGNVIDQFDDDKEEKDREVTSINDIVYDFHKAMLKREREEMDSKRNRTILSKYWYNVSNQYCMTQVKRFKHCPYPDCESVVEFLGFDSDNIASIEEQISLLLIPLVRCGRKHQFCFACMEVSHAPCPCKVVEKWKQKCEDDSETLNWIQSNTKDCPKCHAIIEKNGGCNHLTCTACNYQFCWLCLGDWSSHTNSYRCDQYKGNDSLDGDSVRASLERYMFYFDHFNNQRISHDKDREILEKFESRIRELQIKAGVSWIETVFYKECVTALLECRQILKWSYAFLFYVPKCRGKQLVEAAQWQLSDKVERLSKLFADTPAANVLACKESFLYIKSSMIVAQEKFLETCIDIFADPTTMNSFKRRLNIT